MKNKRNKLERIFDLFNKKYFDGKLPKVYVSWDKKLLRREDALAVSCNGGKNNHWPHIELATEIRFSPRITKITLLHEMVHIKLKHKKDATAHGKDFHQEMIELVRKGALYPLW